MADIFLSYAREDKPAVSRLSAELEAAGLTVWWDHNLAGGARYLKTTEAELNAAKAVLVCWSKTSVESHWVADEAAIGRDEQRLVPISLDGAAPPLGFRQFQVLDFARWGRGDEEALPKLLAALATFVDKPLSAPKETAGWRGAVTKLFRDRRRAAIAALALVGVLGAAAYAVLHRTEAAVGAVTSAAPVPRTAVAVMPFANLTGDPSKEYLGDGMAEELINTLAKVDGLKVPARTSTFAYKGRNTDIRQIAKDLGVGTVLEGSVRAAGQRIRVTAQLINAQDGLHLWSETYDEEFSDIFKLQDKLAKQIARALQPSLSSEAAGRISNSVGTTDVEAYNLNLQGASLLTSFSRDGLTTAEALFQRASQRDPKYARAWSGLAAVHFNISNARLQDSERAEAEAYARKALALDSADVRAMSVMALIAFTRNEIESDEYVQAALAAAPDDAGTRAIYASKLTRVGRLREALVEARKAYALAPANNVAVSALAVALSLNGRDAEAATPLATFRALSGANPTRIYSMVLFRAAIKARQLDNATDLLVAVAKPGVVDRASMAAVVAAITNPAKRPAAVAVKSRFYPSAPPPRPAADIPLQWRADSVATCMASYAYTLAGALDEAYDLANRCLPASIGVINEVLWFPEMRPFRRDPRFADYIDRLGLHLVEYWQKYGPPDDCELKAGKLTCH